MESLILTDNQFKTFLDSMNPPLSKEDYEVQITSFEKLKINNLPFFYNIDHLACLTEISPSQLHLFIKNKRLAYSTFKLPKKRGGFRVINAPSKKMKCVQRWVLDIILYKLDAGEYAHGFLPGRSIFSNASVHVGQELVLGIDIQDFFPTITLNRVRGLFRSMGYNEEISHALGELCTFNWRLPQGAPTSPMISNLIAWHIDIKLAKFCEKRDLHYSRYADDITISGGKDLPRYKKLIFNRIQEEGFKINLKKVRLHHKGSSQRVTGLVVNDKVTIGRKKKNNLKAIVHNIVKNSPEDENHVNDPFFKERIFGHLALAKMIEPDFANPLIEMLQGVDWRNYHRISNNLKMSELNMRSIKRITHNPLVPFDALGFFENVDTLSQIDYTEDLLGQLDELMEKCKPHPTKEECMDCIYKQQESYKKCIKYILAHFIGNTCGTHHGHEQYDIGGETELYGETVYLGILAKTKNDTASKDSLLRQFFDCTELNEINVLSVASPKDLDDKLILRLKRIMNKLGRDKRYCMILRRELGRILYSFNRIK